MFARKAGTKKRLILIMVAAVCITGLTVIIVNLRQSSTFPVPSIQITAQNARDLTLLTTIEGRINLPSLICNQTLLIGKPHELEIWNLEQGKKISNLHFPDISSQEEITAMAVSGDERFVAAGTRINGIAEGDIAIWDLSSEKVINSFGEREIFSVAFDPNRPIIAYTTYDFAATNYIIDILDIHQKSPSVRLQSQFSLSDVSFSPNGEQLAYAFEDKVVLYATRADIETTLQGRFEIDGFAFSPDGTKIVAWQGRDSFTIWDTVTYEELYFVQRERDSISHAVFSPDNAMLATGGGDANPLIRLWEAKTGDLLFEMNSEASRFTEALAFSPDGTILASGSYDGTIQLWNTVDGSLLTSLSIDNLLGLSFALDGRLLVASSGLAVYVWGIES